MTELVLVPSPLVGPRTWTDVADVLRADGRTVHVADLRDVPTAPDAADEARRTLHSLLRDGAGRAALVLHSNAGLYAPLLVEAAQRDVEAVVLVDAGVAGAGPTVPLAPSRLLEHLAGLADADGLLPPWSRWWPADALAQVLPDPLVRAEVEAELRPVPLGYLHGRVPVPDVRVPSAYLRLSAAYDDELRTASARGWPTVSLDGGHLHQVVEPVEVARAIQVLLVTLGAGGGGR